MKRILILAVLLASFALSAQAAENTYIVPPKAEARTAAEPQLPPLAEHPLDAETCRMLVEHQPDDSTALEPSVDVNGKPVLEADINPSPVTVPEKVTFDITVDIAEYAGLPILAGRGTQFGVGTVEVGKDGHMTFNGQPMEGQTEAAIRDLCAGKLKDSSEKTPKVELQKP